MLFKNYLSILLLVVCVHINNPCLSWSKVNVCIDEIRDVFIDCFHCEHSSHSLKEYITYTLDNIIYYDMKSTYVRKYINFLSDALSVHHHTVPFLTTLPKTPDHFCSHFTDNVSQRKAHQTSEDFKNQKRDLKEACIGVMKYAQFPLHGASITVRKVFYEWSNESVNIAFIDEEIRRVMSEFIKHVKTNFNYDESKLAHVLSVETFCKEKSETDFKITVDLESTLLAVKNNTEKEKSIRDDCKQKINQSFEACTDCSEGEEYYIPKMINYVFLNIIYTDINNIYTKFFIDYLYTAVSAKKIGMKVNDEMSPLSYCRGIGKCLDEMKKLKFQTNTVLSSIRKVYYEFSLINPPTLTDDQNPSTFYDESLIHSDNDKHRTQMMNNYIYRIVENFSFEKDAIDLVTPDLFCEVNSDKIRQYAICVENILNTFKDCEQCHEESNLKNFIDFAFAYLKPLDIFYPNSSDVGDNVFSKYFLKHIYKAVNVISTKIPNLPKKFCENKEWEKIDFTAESMEPYDIDDREVAMEKQRKWKENCIKIFEDLKHNLLKNVDNNNTEMMRIVFDNWTYQNVVQKYGQEKGEILKEYILHLQTEYDYIVKKLDTVDTVKGYCKNVTKLLV